MYEMWEFANLVQCITNCATDLAEKFGVWAYKQNFAFPVARFCLESQTCLKWSRPGGFEGVAPAVSTPMSNGARIKDNTHPYKLLIMSRRTMFAA